eukprot:g847.t1
MIYVELQAAASLGLAPPVQNAPADVPSVLTGRPAPVERMTSEAERRRNVPNYETHTRRFGGPLPYSRLHPATTQYWLPGQRGFDMEAAREDLKIGGQRPATAPASVDKVSIQGQIPEFMDEDWKNRPHTASSGVWAWKGKRVVVGGPRYYGGVGATSTGIFKTRNGQETNNRKPSPSKGNEVKTPDRKELDSPFGNDDPSIQRATSDNGRLPTATAAFVFNRLNDPKLIATIDRMKQKMQGSSDEPIKALAKARISLEEQQERRVKLEQNLAEEETPRSAVEAEVPPPLRAEQTAVEDPFPPPATEPAQGSATPTKPAGQSDSADQNTELWKRSYEASLTKLQKRITELERERDGLKGEVAQWKHLANNSAKLSLEAQLERRASKLNLVDDIISFQVATKRKKLNVVSKRSNSSEVPKKKSKTEGGHDDPSNTETTINFEEFDIVENVMSAVEGISIDSPLDDEFNNSIDGFDIIEQVGDVGMLGM